MRLEMKHQITMNEKRTILYIYIFQAKTIDDILNENSNKTKTVYCTYENTF